MVSANFLRFFLGFESRGRSKWKTLGEMGKRWWVVVVVESWGLEVVKIKYVLLLSDTLSDFTFSLISGC